MAKINQQPWVFCCGCPAYKSTLHEAMKPLYPAYFPNLAHGTLTRLDYDEGIWHEMLWILWRYTCITEVKALKSSLRPYHRWVMGKACSRAAGTCIVRTLSLQSASTRPLLSSSWSRARFPFLAAQNTALARGVSFWRGKYTQQTPWT